MPLPRRLWCWVLYNCGSFSCWCNKDKVHELFTWTIQECTKLCPDYVVWRRINSLLQRVNTLISDSLPVRYICLVWFYIFCPLPSDFIPHFSFLDDSCVGTWEPYWQFFPLQQPSITACWMASKAFNPINRSWVLG